MLDTASRHSAGQGRQDTRKPKTDTFTVFGVEQLDVRGTTSVYYVLLQP